MGVYAFFVLTGFVLCCLQAHPLLPFAYAGIRPDLVLILVVYFSAIPYIDICLGALVVSVLGYVLAVLSGAPFGLICLHLPGHICFYAGTQAGY